MAEVPIQTQGHPGQATGANRGRKRPRGRGGKSARGGAAISPTPNTNKSQANREDEEAAISTAQRDAQQDDNTDQDLCWICAEPVKYYAVSECNHRTCHICALRLRALYKKLDCTFCKEPQPTIIFTVSPDAPFSSYTPEGIPLNDQRLAISFESQEMMQDSLVLLRFNCPDSSCDFVATGWNDLKLHARGVHGKLMCDLCIHHKKVFAHEHALYTSPQYFTHLPSTQRRQQKSLSKDQVEGGIHPLCEFCRECFFGDDELYAHMRHTHEECFICKRNEIRDKYFQNYDALERHFEQAHHPCPNPSCQASKFVVFGSQIDLQAHMVEEHGAEMSSRDKKDARRVNAAFEFQDTSSGSTRRRGGGPGGGGGGGGGGGSGGSGREQRDPLSQLGPRQIMGSDSRRSRFGAHLTMEGDTNDSSPGPSRRQTPSPPPPSMDPVTAERYTTIFVRLRTVAPHPINAVAGIKLALRDYTASQSGARDLISTIWSILDRDLDATASIVNLIVERRREFPDLTPTSVGTDYAGIATDAQRAVWDRVAQAAERGASFPPLKTRQQSSLPPYMLAQTTTQLHPPQPPHTGPTPGFRKPSARNTAWSASAAGGTRQAGPTPPAPALTSAAFPTLPSSAAPRLRPIVSARTGQLQHILGSAPPATSAWAPARAEQDEGAGGRDGEEAALAPAPAEAVTGGKKKGKAKQKQMLFSLGSYPSAGGG
ncbi:hypothetical protein B0F90DRAFT_1814209 [Multifurca ochricompacta]|uniref:RING-type E3 ubiquitin transferase n=1 Tax=Multifurca ochricompacta TaxID=376703 RepID=A0AAD4QQ42_9AGAM|nr:hypothetical protein B0F90DRAFT_1814209 [Multifurca ochricompacta]